MKNAEVARIFEELAELLQLDGANPFRTRAYRNAARTISDYRGSIATLAEQGTPALMELPGIGADLAAKIVTLVETGKLPQLEELRTRVPPGVVQMLRIPGLGPKKAVTLFRELGIQSLDQLRAAIEEGRVASLKGFGQKTADSILQGLGQVETAGQRVLLMDAKNQAEEIVADLRELDVVTRADVAGSCRRRRETCADLDILATATDAPAAMDYLGSHRRVEAVLSRGDTKQRVKLWSGLELDLRVVPEESYGAALQYFTGSAAHNIVIRRRAQERGLRINEYAVTRDGQSMAGRTEEEVYAAVGLAWIPPELREDRGEIDLAAENKLPRLIELADIRGDLHMHTTASDGTASIREMAEAARERKLEYIAITDHSQRVTMANGLDAARLRAHWAEIEQVRGDFSDLHILRGIECDILENATLDLADDVLAEADFVIAVLHYGLRQPREQIMRRLLTAVRSPHVDIIGHPSGRMLTRREGADIDFDVLFRAAADHGVLLEINAHPSRLDLDDVRAAAAAHDFGIPIMINTDAHSPQGLDMMQYGIFQARRAALEKKHVANTRTHKQFVKMLRRS